MDNGIVTLKERLQDWTDIDFAGYHVTVVLGLIDPEQAPFSTRAKHVFWSVHPVGDLAVKLLDEMTADLSGDGRFSDLVVRVVGSEQFRNRRSGWEPPPPRGASEGQR